MSYRAGLCFREIDDVLDWANRNSSISRNAMSNGRTRAVPHIAVVDPTGPPDVLSRESIELRALVFHRA